MPGALPDGLAPGTHRDLVWWTAGDARVPLLLPVLVPSALLPPRPVHHAPSTDWRAYFDALCLTARRAEALSWSLVEAITDAFVRGGQNAPLATRGDWEQLLAALRANPAWDEVGAVNQVARMTFSSPEEDRPGFPGVCRWHGIGRLLANSALFADRARTDAHLHSVLWHCAVPTMDTLWGIEHRGKHAWPRFAALVLARAGTEGPETLRRWRQRLTRHAEPLAEATRRHTFDERVHLAAPSAAGLAATLACHEAPADFAEAVQSTLDRQPLVAVLALAQATPAQWAAVDPAVVAQVLSLPGLAAHWRVALLTAPASREPATVPSRRR